MLKDIILFVFVSLKPRKRSTSKATYLGMVTLLFYLKA